ncbi:DMT family transporter [Sphingomonas sp. ASV193]|uniref:DMT family transporter n=1 Tax=Sphingomonas sp. ASV193 TaxID=3144405 RepID=UPI0032E8979D
MPSLILPMLAVLFAGALIAVQAPTNALVAKAGGSPLIAALVSFGVGAAALLAVWVVRGPRVSPAAFRDLPWYAWLGGLYGAAFVGIAAWAAPRLGLASLITIGIAGQIAMALYLDSIGAFGLPKEPLSATRLIGSLIVFGGVYLVRRG